MSRKPSPKPDDPAQSKRFIEMAREVGADGSKTDLEHALRKIAKAKSKDEPKKRNGDAA